MKAPSPAFSFYPKDIESDEACKAMNHAEFGMYIRLLMNCWTEGSIPADPERLQRLLRVSSRTFSAAWPAIAPCFTPGEDGRLVQSRLETEREKQVQRREENKRKGRSGGRPAKSNVSAESEKPRVMNGFPDRKPNESLPSPSPSPVVTTYQKSLPVVVVPEPSDADAARGELKSALSDLRQRFPSFAIDADQAILDNPRFHSTGGGICRIETCTNPGLLRATAAKVRAYGKQPKPKAASRGAPAWDLGTTRYTEAEILAWDERLGPKPQPANPA